ncbi:hypothetical protein ACSW9V_15370 (plasmid) [Clostridium perfringens]|nr:hypothetical protein [Clostridium perfringens]EGT0696434.1 hypothetical protein [Clostridium perfringens]MDU3376263.1 hypothetical protein [Clostridium perfringens]MDU3534219.1 hypothetical protein [Clostridium perfringens]
MFKDDIQNYLKTGAVTMVVVGFFKLIAYYSTGISINWMLYIIMFIIAAAIVVQSIGLVSSMFNKDIDTRAFNVPNIINSVTIFTAFGIIALI